jgi:hypothetical protein
VIENEGKAKPRFRLSVKKNGMDGIFRGPHILPASLWANHSGNQVSLVPADLIFCQPEDILG